MNVRPMRLGRVNINIGRWLRRLVGTDEDLLGRVPLERSRRTALGGIVVSTSLLSTVALFFTLNTFDTTGLGSLTYLALPIWFLLVLNLDRWLVSIPPPRKLPAVLVAFLPRFLIAILLGAAIAEPLLLQVFRPAIATQVQADRQAAQSSLGYQLLQCNKLISAGLPNSDPQCSGLRLAVAGAPLAQTASLAALKSQIDDQRAVLNSDMATLDKLDDAAMRECAGVAGPGLTGVAGDGPACATRRAEADSFARSIDIAGRTAMIVRLEQNANDLTASIAETSASYQASLSRAVDGVVSQKLLRSGPASILEESQALAELMTENPTLAAGVWALRLLLVIVGVLPVLTRVLGGVTAYDQLADSTQETSGRIHDSQLQLKEFEASVNNRLERDIREAEAARASADAHLAKAKADYILYDELEKLTMRLYDARRGMTDNADPSIGELNRGVTSGGNRSQRGVDSWLSRVLELAPVGQSEFAIPLSGDSSEDRG